MIRAGIMGAAGYTGGELIRLLLEHPGCEIGFVHSRSHQGEPVYIVHTDLIGLTDLHFCQHPDWNVDVIFLCMGHGESSAFLAGNSIPSALKIIDLSQDFRLAAEGNNFIYGLPEAFRESIRRADRVANPGCFATAIELALLPLAAGGYLPDALQVTGITGSTGAGQQPTETTHFSWRQANVSVYKAFRHQHLAEIEQTLQQVASRWSGRVNFLPLRGSFTRGILVAASLPWDEQVSALQKLYRDYYQTHPFVHVTDRNPDIKQVVNTNRALLYLEKSGETLLIVSVIDNLLKGASGQAVQNMNLMFGLEEFLGLRLKAAVF